jgi:DNA polymerase-3 subunit epsilon
MKSFVAIDVETANADISSICQIGLVRVQDGIVRNGWTTLVDPECDFHPGNIAIHGITPSQVRGQPRFADLAGELRRFVGPRVVASHTGFDRVALARAYARYGLECPDWSWLDTTRVVRRTWPQFSKRGYGLARVAAHCGITFGHHDAGEDARAAALILLRAMEETGLDITDWMARVQRPIRLRRARVRRDDRGSEHQGDSQAPSRT